MGVGVCVHVVLTLLTLWGPLSTWWSAETTRLTGWGLNECVEKRCVCLATQGPS